MKYTTQTISEMCPIDDNPHNFLPTPDKADWVYCTKCLRTMSLTYDDAIPPDPPDPPDPLPEDTIIFEATGGDDTRAIQDLFDSVFSGSIIDIRGMVGINSNGISIGGLDNITVMSTNGGGFKATGNNPYTGPFAAMVYVEGLTGSQFNTLKFDCNGKRAMGIYLHECAQTKVLNCEAYNVANDPNGAPWAAIYGERNRDVEIGFCNVHDTEHNVRGIWFGVGDRFEVRTTIHNCTVRHTGHTGIVVEGEGPNVYDNAVYDTYSEGTGYKFIPRGQAVETWWVRNHVENTNNSGFMVEGSGEVYATKVNMWDWVAKNCGAQGTSFGMVYVSGNGVENMEIKGCSIENCRSVAGLRYMRNSKFENNQIKSGSNSINFEEDCHNVTIQNSGTASVGNNCSDIWVDGNKVA